MLGQEWEELERSEKDEEASYYMAATFDDLIWGDKTEAAGPKYWSLFYRSHGPDLWSSVGCNCSVWTLPVAREPNDQKSGFSFA